jgi:hypothetical protein
VEIGSHEELLARGGRYAELFQLRRYRRVVTTSRWLAQFCLPRIDPPLSHFSPSSMTCVPASFFRQRRLLPQRR